MRARVSKALADERVRFLIVGGWNTLFYFLVFVAVNATLGQWVIDLGYRVWSSVVTLVVAHFIASVPAFILYRRAVFKVSGNVARDYVKFQAVYVVPFSLNLFALPALVWAGMAAVIAQAIITFVNVVLNYLGHKYFSFKR